MLLWGLKISSVYSAVITPSIERGGAVSCESRRCSEIGIELLERGVSNHVPSFGPLFQGLIM